MCNYHHSQKTKPCTTQKYTSNHNPLLPTWRYSLPSFSCYMDVYIHHENEDSDSDFWLLRNFLLKTIGGCPLPLLFCLPSFSFYFQFCMSLNNVVRLFQIFTWIEAHYVLFCTFCFCSALCLRPESIYGWNNMMSEIWLKIVQRWRSCKVFIKQTGHKSITVKGRLWIP